jgi:hypothetical protein
MRKISIPAPYVGVKSCKLASLHPDTGVKNRAVSTGNSDNGVRKWKLSFRNRNPRVKARSVSTRISTSEENKPGLSLSTSHPANPLSQSLVS